VDDHLVARLTPATEATVREAIAGSGVAVDELWIDIDTRDVLETADEIAHKIRRLPVTPEILEIVTVDTEIVRVIFRLRTPATTEQEFVRVVTVLRSLAKKFCGDPSFRIIRLDSSPTTHTH
jgi:hypothetical protein